MLQPVVPYAVVGLALGSMIKRPGTGAVVGALVGTAATTRRPTPQLSGYGKWWDWMVIGGGPDRKVQDWEMGRGKRATTWSRAGNVSTRVRQGDFKGTPFSRAPKTVKSVDDAKLAAGWAYKVGKPKKHNEGWSAYDIAYWTASPWVKKRSVKSVIDAAMKSGISTLAKSYLLGVRGRYSSPKAAAGLYTPWKDAVKKKEKKEKKKRYSSGYAPVQGPREDTRDYISASGPANGKEGGEWYKTTGGKVGIAALAGGGALVLILLLMKR